MHFVITAGLSNSTHSDTVLRTVGCRLSTVYLVCVYSVGALGQSSGMRLDGPVVVGIAWDWVVWFCSATPH